MTVTDIRALTDEEIAGLYDAAAEDDRAACLAELERRDLAERTAPAREALAVLRAEGELAAYAQYREAEAWCRGRLLSREGMAAGIAEEDLWRLPADKAARYSSEELRDYHLFVKPRITAAGYVRQRAAEARAARMEAREAGEAGDLAADDPMTEGEISDDGFAEHDDTSGPGLAGDDAGAFRHGASAEEAPQAGSGCAVHGARPGTGPAEDGEDAGTAAGGPGRPVRPVAREDGDDMGEGGTRAKTFAETDEIDQEWLWPGMIPAGLLTVVFGPPKASKTTLVVDYAARVSRGDVNPDGTSLGPAAPVLMGALEDISESSTVKKLKAARADLSMVVDVSGGPDGDGLELSLDHIAWLHEVAAEYPGVALIVVDTLSSSATRPTTTRQGLKAMLKPLAKLAANTGAAVLLTAHSLKGHDDVPEGGQALVSIPRMVLSVQRSKDEPGVRTLSVYASNVASDSGGGFRYRLAGAGAETRIEWAWDSVRTGPGPEATAQARILLLLKNTPEAIPLRLVAARTGILYPTAAVLLSRMKKRGEVIPGAERGTWTVPGPQESLAS
jgi:hypothetical protein